MRKFHQLALAAAMTAGFAGASAPAYSMIVDAAGEALLVPLVIWDDPRGPGDVNTIIEVTIPSSVGWEDVANQFTAPNTTPTNADLSLWPADADLEAQDTLSAIHWFFFDKESKPVLDRKVPVTPDDVYQINWRQVASNSQEGKAGYMVISTEAAARGGTANFAMYGNAYLVTDIGVTATIPVLPMADEADAPFPAFPTQADNVLYAGLYPYAVSPLISGIRIGYTDGNPDDLTSFDLMLSDRYYPTLHVIWMDQNNKDLFAHIDVFDTEENVCSGTVPLPYELNVIWIDPLEGDYDGMSGRDRGRGGAPEWATAYDEDNYCEPFGRRVNYRSGYVQYILAEALMDDVDRGTGTAENSAAAFSIKVDTVPGYCDNDGDLGPCIVAGATALAHERGTFQIQ